jgi:hypothetical protein
MSLVLDFDQVLAMLRYHDDVGGAVVGEEMTRPGFEQFISHVEALSRDFSIDYRIHCSFSIVTNYGVG